MTHSQHAKIAEQAYFLWLNDGMKNGKAEQHWALAEKLVAQPTSQTAAPTSSVKTRKSKAKTAPRASNVRANGVALHA